MSNGDEIRIGELWQRQCADAVASSRTRWVGTLTNSGNAYTGVSTVKLHRLLTGELVRCIINAANTGAATLAITNPDGTAAITATSIKRFDGSTALSANDLVAGPAEFIYDGTNLRLCWSGFGGTLTGDDETYGSGWNGDLTFPTKNAVYDKIQTIASDVLFDHFADANNVDTTETDLYSDTLAAGQLANNGEKVIAQYGGSLSGDATSTQRIRAYFGGTLIFDTGALGIGVTTSFWDLYISIIRESSSVVRCSASLTTSFAALSAYDAFTRITGLTLANTQIVKVTGTAAGATGASNQVAALAGYVEFKPAA